MKKEADCYRILIVDDHQILIDGIRSLLEDQDDFGIVAEAHSGEQALEFLSANKVEIVLSDYGLPGINGLQLFERIKQSHPDCRVIILSMHDEPHIVKEILKSGVHGYLLKNIDRNELITALTKVSKDQKYTSSEITELLVKNLHKSEYVSPLTSRERQILELISKEYTNKQMAEELFISERTVENHRKNIFRKTGTNSLVGLIKYAYANNLI
jgi:DNA-binding NarL/FixJ family response regulator